MCAAWRSLPPAPWRFIAGLFIVVAMLAFHFVGGGMGDAADPHA